ncbi:NAD(P)-dependent alcohol dehydrogenase [Hymenobacter sp. B81]|uniref:NAD(P)-dependent alcohol dehydrogenase n=1 Tax=Hymenobacter sp. B81 TaxID=3344878 RepID=UPI0037DDCAAD
MNAVICPRYGPPDVLQLTQVPRPTPRPDELLIRIRATTVTAADCRVRGFRVPRAYWLPARLALGWRKPRQPILGVELAGEIEAVGAEVRGFRPGERVFAAALRSFGAYADYICLPAHAAISPMPVGSTFEEAAALPIGARTALHYLRRAAVGPGQRVLVCGAAGSVGSYAVQLARYFGAQVTALCRGADAAWVRALGAATIVDYTAAGYAQQLQTYDVVFVAVEGYSFAFGARLLRPRGAYVDVTAPLKSLPMHWARLRGRLRLVVGEPVPESAPDLRWVKELVEAGALRPVLDRCYPLADIVAAHRYVEQGHKKGNVAIAIG